MTQEELNTLIDIFAASAGGFIKSIKELIPEGDNQALALFAFAVCEAKFLGMIRSELAQGLEFPTMAGEVVDALKEKIKEAQKK